MKKVLFCNLTAWTRPAVGRDALTMRPGPSRIARYLAWSALGVLAATGSYFLPRDSSPYAVHIAMVGVALFGMLAVVPLLGAVFGQFRVSRTPRGDMHFFYWNYLPARRSWPIARFDTLAIFVMQDGAHWNWVAQPQRADVPIPPMMGQLMFSSGDTGPILLLDRQSHPPSTNPQLPARVNAFATSFQKTTGIPFSKPIVTESYAEPRVGGGTLRTTYSTIIEDPVITEQTYSSLDEVPPEMRARIQEFMERAQHEGDGVFTATSHRITVTDESGQTRVYNSLEEMPPEMRERFRKLK